MSIADMISAEAARQGVDPSLALELAIRESNLNQSAIGAAGEIGIFQLRLDTAAQLGVNPNDTQGNISGGIAYLRQQLARFGDPAKALAAYNCGPGCVSNALTFGDAWFAHIPASTRDYVNTILGNVQSKYSAQFNPAPTLFPVAGAATVPPATSQTSPGIWWTLGIAVVVMFGLGYVLEQS